MKTPTIAVAILFFNKLKQTIECIQSFLESKTKIYVFNNGSELTLRKGLGVFCDHYPQIKIFDSDQNIGVGMGRNYLIEHTPEDWLFFADNDIKMLTLNWLGAFSKHILNYPKVEVFIPKVFNVHEDRYILPVSYVINPESKKVEQSYIKSGITNSFPGGASLVSKKLFQRLGLYDSEIFVGFEDFELAIRGIKSAQPIIAQIVKNVELSHYHRYVAKPADQQSVYVRYDYQTILASWNRICKKHDVLLDKDFGPWLNQQVRQLTNQFNL